MRLFRVLMGILLLLALVPALSTAAAQAIELIYGCTPDMAAVKPCIVFGRDIGEGLFMLATMSGFLLASLPAIFSIVLYWIFIEVVSWVSAWLGT